MYSTSGIINHNWHVTISGGFQAQSQHHHSNDKEFLAGLNEIYCAARHRDMNVWVLFSLL